MEGVWGCLGTGLDVILSRSPGTRLGAQEQRVHPVQGPGDWADPDPASGNPHPWEEGQHGCAFLLP